MEIDSKAKADDIRFDIESPQIEQLDLPSLNMQATDSYQSTTSQNNTSLSQVIEDDPIVVHKHFFHIREYHENDFISSLDFTDKLVAIGTTTGSVYKLDNLGAVSKVASSHKSKVTSIVIEEGAAIISASEKGIIHIHPLTQDFDDIIINLGVGIPIT